MAWEGARLWACQSPALLVALWAPLSRSSLFVSARRFPTCAFQPPEGRLFHSQNFEPDDPKEEHSHEHTKHKRTSRSI